MLALWVLTLPAPELSLALWVPALLLVLAPALWALAVSLAL